MYGIPIPPTQAVEPDQLANPALPPASIGVRRARLLVRRVRGDSLLRNSVYGMATTAATSALGYLYWIMAARVYPARDVGLGAALVAAMTLASSFSSLGFGATLVRLLPRRTASRAWSTLLNAGLACGVATGLVAGLMTVLILPMTVHALADPWRRPLMTALLVCGVPLWTASTLLDAAFLSARAAGNILARNTVFSALKAPLLVAPLVVSPHGADGATVIVGSWVLATALALIAGFVLLRRVKPDYDPLAWRVGADIRVLRGSLAAQQLIDLGGAAPLYLLPLLVTARLSPAQNAYFYTTWMIGGLFFAVSPAVASALFAEAAYVVGDKSVGTAARSALALSAALLGPVIVLMLLRGSLVLGLFGPAYPRYGTVLLALLVISAVPDAITNIYVGVGRGGARPSHAAALNLAMAATTLVLAWLLLPILGIAGAGWAWLAAQTAGSVAVGAGVLSRRGQAGDVTLAVSGAPEQNEGTRPLF